MSPNQPLRSIHFANSRTGDTDGSGSVDLADMVLTLQSMNKTDETDLGANLCAEVNGDGRIGMEEVIYILQKVSGLR